MRVVIIEDEYLVAEDLSASLKQLNPNIIIESVLSSVQEAVAYFSQNTQPDLIFSDIQLGDGVSFDIFKKIEIKVPVIFCTAFDEYAIEAFKTNGIAYILKPYSFNTLKEGLSKFENLKKMLAGDIIKQYETAIKTLDSNKLNESQTFMVKYRDRFLPVSFDKIALFYLENENNHLYLFSGKTYHIPNSLEEVEKKTGNLFFRVNRQFLINRNAIKEATEHFPRKLKVNLNFQFDKEIIVSKEKKGKLLDWLLT
jgi:DNA-binding LytR/AlgR family response regulator